MADPDPTLRDVLTELRALRDDHGKKLETLTRAVADLRADHGAKLDRILRTVQGQATARLETDNRVAALERDVDELKRAAG